MKKISTLISSEAESQSLKVNEMISETELSPKDDTLIKLRRLARIAFSDAALTGMPLIILN